MENINMETLDALYNFLKAESECTMPIPKGLFFYYSGQIDFLSMISGEETRKELKEMSEKIYERYRKYAETAE